MADTFHEGMKMRRAVLGDEHVDSAEKSKTAFDEDFQEFITRYAWGDVWQRGTLDVRERHLVPIAVLCALGRHEELAMHVRATQNTGVTRDEVREVFHQVAVYAGVPAANAGFAIAKQIFAEDE